MEATVSHLLINVLNVLNDSVLYKTHTVSVFSLGSIPIELLNLTVAKTTAKRNNRQ